jgi:hypothetical protein
MSRYRVSPDTLVAALDGVTVLLHLDSKRYFSLNETGAMIWRLVESGAEEEVIVGQLVQQYQVAAPEARRTVLDVLERLTDAALVSKREDEGQMEVGA